MAFETRKNHENELTILIHFEIHQIQKFVNNKSIAKLTEIYSIQINEEGYIRSES